MSVTTGVPELAEEAVDALPRRRNRTLSELGGLAAATAALVLVLLVTRDGGGAHDDALTLAGWLAPWAIALPWLKRLDLRPVPWFFLCAFLGLVMTPVLAFKVVKRALSLPYRDWPVEHWHGHRARAVPGSLAVVLVSPGSVPEPTRRPWVSRTERVQRIAWTVSLPVIVLALVFEDHVSLGLGTVLLVGLLVLMASHVVEAVLLSRPARKRPIRTA